MYAWEGIQSALDYIEGHLNEEIPAETLAEKAALSPFYFQKLFSRLVKRPLREYIKLRRLSRASELLTAQNPAGKPAARIVDIALDCGFGSHQVFSRAFKEAYGITPEQYRERPIFLNHFDKPDLTLNYVTAELGVPMVSEGMVLEVNWQDLSAPVKFMGVQGYVPIAGQMPVGEETGPDIPGEIWERFHREKGKLPRLPGGRELGVAFMGDAPQGSFTYFAGAEVAPEAELEGPLAAAGFCTWQLEARKYLVCGFEAENFMELVTVAINKAIKYTQHLTECHHLTAEQYAPDMYYDSSPEGNYMYPSIPAEEKKDDTAKYNP